jgi:hypothetical protein
MLLLRRFLELAALFFWLGGFTFYAGVVVPIGQEVFGSLEQGFVTRQVTVYLNLSGAIALGILLCEGFAARDPAAWRRRTRWLLWGGMLVTLVVLYWLHRRLEELLDPEEQIVRNAKAFRPRHRLYLWISTVQWACGLLYTFLTLAAWRAEDRSATIPRVGQPSKEGNEERVEDR